MRICWLLVLVVACTSDDRVAPKPAEVIQDDGVAAAQRAADDAKRAMEKAQSEAAEAWKRADTARAEHAAVSQEHEQAKAKLVALREEAAATLRLADTKLAALKGDLDRLKRRLAQATTKAERDKLTAEVATHEQAIAKIVELKADLEAASK